MTINARNKQSTFNFVKNYVRLMIFLYKTDTLFLGANFGNPELESERLVID